MILIVYFMSDFSSIFLFLLTARREFVIIKVKKCILIACGGMEII